MNIKLDINTLTKFLSYGPCIVHSLKGRNPTGASLYLQLHDKPVVLANDVPIIAGMECPTVTWFDWFDQAGWGLSQCTIAVSTTQNLYTAPGAGGGVDFTVVISTDTAACDKTGTSLVTVSGDLTSAVLNRQVWASASGPKKLLRLDVKNNSGSDAYPIISAADSPTAVNSAQTVLPKVVDAATGTYFFGNGGLSPVERVTSAGAHLNRVGCNVACATARAVGTSIIAAGTPFNIRAVYLT